MAGNELDLSFLIIIVSIVLIAFASFIICIVIVFNRRRVQHQEKLSKVQLQQSRELLTSSVNAQERERKRIGADIHDDIGPLLSLVKLQLNQIETQKLQTSRDNSIKECKETIDQIIGNIRTVSKNLVPSVLFELGISEALQQIEEQLKSYTDAQVSIEIPNDIDSLSANQGLAIYRILQEGLNNVLKHADANIIDVTIKLADEKILITIFDDGKGFDVNKNELGFGLSNIEARAQIFNGTLNIDTEQNQGTTLTITMQLDEQAN